jgi:mono/diheme cytochrome c family protein
MKRFAPLALLALLAVPSAACDVPTPLAPAEPIGEVPNWGEGFATPTEQPSSLLGSGSGQLGNTGLPAGTQSPGDTGSWSGGDPALGKGLFVALCARCHGENGEGGQVPGGAKVPSLADAQWQASVEDRQIARTVMLGKGAMPSFMKEGLDKPKLAGIVAYIRSLKK